MWILRRLRPWLTHRRLPLALALLAVTLTLPSLRSGLSFDDFAFQRMSDGKTPFPFAPPGSPRALSSSNPFAFMSDPQTTRATMNLGMPWWTNPSVRLVFWRPLAALSHRLDFLLWPHHPFLMHAQNLLWLALIVVAAARLYRRLIGPSWVAGLAALLFTVHKAQGLVAGWVANRNMQLALLCGLLMLLAYDRWRRDGWRAGAVLAPLALGASLLSAEAGTASAAWLLAYALFVDRGSWATRGLHLLPCAAVGLLWAVAHHGFGTHGSGWYFDPLTEPARYWGAFLERAPMLLLNVFTLLDSELYPFLPRAWAHLALAVAVLLLGGLVALLARQVRQSPLARFWALAALLSLLPVCANSPAGRLTLFVAFATLGLLAQLLGAAVERGDGLGAPFPRGARGLVAIAVGLHLVLAPLTVPVVSGLQVMGTLLGGLAASLPRDPALAQQSLVLVGGPDPFAGYLWSLPAMSGQPAPARIWTLGVGLAPLALYRPDARTLVVRPEGGFLRDRFAPLVFRDPRDLLPLGQQVHLAGLTVEVTALTNDGRPAEATFRFAVPLEDPALRWMRWSGGLELSPFTPPAVGETRALGEVTLQRRVGVSSR